MDIELLTPKELGIEEIDVEEKGETLKDNALLKARAYLGKTDLPILANDTGVWVEGEGMVTAPKRIALNGRDERDMSKEEIAEAMRGFWTGMANKYGGEVSAAFPETFALVMPDGTEKTADVRREITLTNKEFGTPHLSFPIRSLYISKTTGKPAVTHTQEEEDAELAPVRNGLLSLLVA
jgi:inosine/xanthosine triphosphate pyrophosphatase family protein